MNQFLKSSRPIIWLIVLWNVVSIIFMASGVWPEWVSLINLALAAIFVLAAEPYDSVLLLIALIPFYIAVPNQYSDTLVSWRLLFAELFAVWAARMLGAHRGKTWSAIRLFSWDRALFALAAWSALLLPFTQYRGASVKQLLFFVNIYLLYIVLVHSVSGARRMKETIGYAAVSLAIIVFLGYVQLFLTFFTSLERFWKAWALMVSSLYYGQSLAGVLLYSNSWFSYTGGGEGLRMFSILPDSHAFALVAVFAVAFILPLTYYFFAGRKIWRMKANYWLWSAVRFSGLAIILSGTRAVWVGMAGPLAFVFWTYRKRLGHPIARKALVALGFIVVFFALSPFINQGLNYLRVSKFQENFLDRARSIYDLQEDSNAGRLQIWRQSLSFYAGHPLGVGLGNFIVSLNGGAQQDYRAAAEAHNKEFNLPAKYITAHSLYLQLLVELGIAGLGLFAWFCFAYLAKVEKFVRGRIEENNVFVFFTASAAMAVLWVLVAGMFDVTLFNDRVLMYFFIALGLSGVAMREYEQLK